jgi:hypothetical protein
MLLLNKIALSRGYFVESVYRPRREPLPLVVVDVALQPA